MKRIKAAVIGIGFIGAAHVEALKRVPYVDVIAVAGGRNIREKAERMDVPNCFQDYRQMIDACRPDCVHICTPNDTHMEIAGYALAHGCHVICEKPMGLNADEAEIMLETAKKSRLVHALNFHNRYYPAVHNLRNMVKDGELGRIFAIQGGYLQDWLSCETDFNWKINSGKVGKTRAVADIGSHWIDLSEYVTGQRVTEVFAEFKTVYPVRKRKTEQGYDEIPVDTEDMAYVMFRYDGGAVGSAVFSTVFSGKKNQTTLMVQGTDMSVSWDNENLEKLEMGLRKEPNRIWMKGPEMAKDQTAPIIAYPAGHMEGFPDAFKQNFEAIYQVIRGEKPGEQTFATFEDGLHLMKLCDKIFESAKTGKWVRL